MFSIVEGRIFEKYWHMYSLYKQMLKNHLLIIQVGDSFSWQDSNICCSWFFFLGYLLSPSSKFILCLNCRGFHTFGIIIYDFFTRGNGCMCVGTCVYVCESILFRHMREGNDISGSVGITICFSLWLKGFSSPLPWPTPSQFLFFVF